MQHWQCWKVSTTRIFGSERAISIHWFQHQPKAQIPGHTLPIPCPKALLAVNLNVLVLPFHMRSCAHWHCALREHQSTKHNQLQLPAHSVFIIRSVVHWKPKVKINLSTTVNWEKKMLGLFLLTGPERLSGNCHIRVIRNWSCLRVQKGLVPRDIHPKSVCLPLHCNNILPCYKSWRFAGTDFFPCCSRSQESGWIISSSFFKENLTARKISLKIN